MKTMHMRLAVVGAIVGVVLAAAPSVGAQTLPNCTVRTNLEAIIDDSGSMYGTDPELLRSKGMQLFIDSNKGKTLGAVEFGTGADSLFVPMPIDDASGLNMKNVINQRIIADGGSTNYNAAFDLANAENSAAQARIFLTDGAHNVDVYANGHLNPPRVPTYVIGFGSGLLPEDHARLGQIAADTGGKYYQQTDSSRLQAIFNEISAILNCLNPPRTIVDNFTRVGQQKRHTHPVAATTGVIELVTSWSTATSKFTIPRASLDVIRNGVVVATRVRRLRVTRSNGDTFSILRISNLRRGKLVFKVKAVRLSSGFFTSNPNRAVTQVTAKRRT